VKILIKFILKRLVMLIPVLIGVSFVVFTIGHLMPGCPSSIILGEAATEEARETLRKEMGLNNPFLVQYSNYLINLLQGDFGNSWVTQRSVLEENWVRFPTTIQLSAMSVVLALILGIPLGILSATKQYTAADVIANFTGLIAVSIPNFWQGMIFIILFSVTLQWLPATGWETPLHWVLPVVTLGTSAMALIMRMTRSSMLEVIRQDYIRTARAKGQKESKIILNHALKNALSPVITVIGLQFGLMLGGAIITEAIFSIPGLGRFMVDAIGRRDFPIIQGGVLLIALSFSIVNLLVDILYAYVDPRIKSQY
jgi:peptide/nickel transport system permease protein